jgi:hypothetical protein
MTNAKYLVVMCKKAMEKPVVKVIRETHCKEREENRVKKSANYLTVDERASQCVVIRSARAHFQYHWFAIIVKEVGQHLHVHLQTS